MKMMYSILALFFVCYSFQSAPLKFILDTSLEACLSELHLINTPPNIHLLL